MGLLFVGIYVTHYVVTLLTGFALEGVGPDAPDYLGTNLSFITDFGRKRRTFAFLEYLKWR